MTRNNDGETIELVGVEAYRSFTIYVSRTNEWEKNFIINWHLLLELVQIRLFNCRSRSASIDLTIEQLFSAKSSVERRKMIFCCSNFLLQGNALDQQ
jgi:hypothetical protein